MWLLEHLQLCVGSGSCSYWMVQLWDSFFQEAVAAAGQVARPLGQDGSSWEGCWEARGRWSGSGWGLGWVGLLQQWGLGGRGVLRKSLLKDAASGHEPGPGTPTGSTTTHKSASSTLRSPVKGAGSGPL